MATIITKENYAEAVKTLNNWAYAYYTLGNEIATDSMYDEMYFAVKTYEETTGDINPASPTQRVGDKVLSGFEKSNHIQKMYSLDDVFNPEEFLAWAKKIQLEYPHVKFYEEPKYDGLSLNILYENGNLVKATTRGDGEEGENVTANIPHVQGIPLHIDYTGTVEIRGEVTIFKSDFPEINRLRVESGKEAFKNERGAAAGALRSFDSASVKAAKLKFTPYGLGHCDQEFDLQSGSYNWILSQGFINWGTNELVESTNDPLVIVKAYDKIIETRDKYPMLLDGVVIKVDQKSIQAELGFTNKFPKWGIAFKFPAEEAETVILDIIYQVGKTGAITPVAVVEDTLFDGVTVNRATLHNFSEIERQDIRIGDTVTLIRSGDVIPKITGVHVLKRTGEEVSIVPPEVCPVCGSASERKTKYNSTELSTNLYCSNHVCPAIVKERIAYAVSKKAFNISGVGESAIEELVEKGMVEKVSDLFDLTIEDLLKLEGFKDRKATKSISAIQSKVGSIGVAQFINVLDIELIGDRASKKLAVNQLAVELILGLTDQEPKLEDFTSIADIGGAMGENIMEFLETKSEEISELKDKVQPIIPDFNAVVETVESAITGKKVCITGTLSQSRGHFADLVEANGGKVSSSVSKATDYLLAGESAGSKLEKAEKLGITVLSEEDFNQLIS